MIDLSSLNDKQKESVTAPLGPVLVLAGAGSGKTRALTFRIAYLCEQGMARPEHILALTFTNKAAKEMKARVEKIQNPESKSNSAGLPHMGTFHSICARILRQDISRLGYTRGFTIYDSDDQNKIIKEIVQDLHIDKRYNPSLFKAYISSAKNILQLPAEFNVGIEGDLHNLVQQVYIRYQDYLYKQNGVDFDDLLMLTVKIFQNFPDVLKKYQELFGYVLVDEYQDTNHAQYVFLYLLSEHHHNLFVVGDDAQSIYGFRGSSIRNILNFEQDFPEARVIKLEQNYRSTKNILSVAQKVIEINTDQKPKTLWTENEAGRKIEVHELGDEMDEAKFVAKKIVDMASGNAVTEELEYESEDEAGSGAGFSILDHFLKKSNKGGKGLSQLSFLPQLSKDHKTLTEFAVLFRTHSQSRALEEVFIQSAIPYQIVGGLRFYERKEIKDIIAYLRLAINYRDLLSLKRVINEPARGIGERSYQIIKDVIMEESVETARMPELQQAGDRIDHQLVADQAATALANFRSKIKAVKFGPKIGAAVDGFFDLVAKFQTLAPEESIASLMRLIVKRTNYEAWVRDGTESGEARWENIEELFTVVEKFKGKPWRAGVEQFLEEVALITEVDETQQKDSVTMMTLHSAKGLEFDTVFLVGLEEGILPHSRSLLSPSELSEEVRLAYVGLTRARQNLYLTYARMRRSFGSFNYNQPSRILRALPKDKVVWKGKDLDSMFEEDDGGEQQAVIEELDF